MKKEEKEVYVMLPDVKCWYGVKVNKNTKLEFENDFVKQKVENLVLISDSTQETEEYKSKVHLEVKLNEGDILMLEEEKRGYFLPRDIPIGTIDEAFNELKLLKEQIEKIK